MEKINAQIIETLVALATYVVLKQLLQYAVRSAVMKSYFKISEKKEVMKIINLISFVVLCIIIVAIWSVKQEHVLLFASSLLTVFGVALFAEMSILSNITACLILFFLHPVKTGDTITITHEGNELSGKITDITYFFVFIKTPHKGTVTIPNALLLKTTFSIIDNTANNENGGMSA
jgi:small-conductance mechanosensitive channel